MWSVRVSETYFSPANSERTVQILGKIEAFGKLKGAPVLRSRVQRRSGFFLIVDRLCECVNFQVECSSTRSDVLFCSGNELAQHTSQAMRRHIRLYDVGVTRASEVVEKSHGWLLVQTTNCRDLYLHSKSFVSSTSGHLRHVTCDSLG